MAIDMLALRKLAAAAAAKSGKTKKAAGKSKPATKQPPEAAKSEASAGEGAPEGAPVIALNPFAAASAKAKERLAASRK